MITDIEIKDEFYKLLKSSELAKEVTGAISKRLRPKNSTKEDVVVSIVTNVGGQKQEAVVNVNIYVADDFVKDQYEEATIRIRTLAKMAQALLDHGTILNGRYELVSQNSIENVEGTNEHIINNKLSVTLINE